jgi:hydroxyethylthiazole kinase-like uncharacterized protein yjeF
MRGVHDVAEVRVAEEAVLARTLTGELMTRAATGLARTCAAVLTQSRGGVYGARVALLVGGGNNGGDALFAGARLAARGASVVAVAAGEVMHDSGRTALLAAGGRVTNSGDDTAESVVTNADMVVDGLLGIGGHGGLRGRAADLARAATESDAVVVAVDLPSGVDADTGFVAGEAVWADVTVTFGSLKPGLLVPPGADHVGLLEVVDIGLGNDLVAPSTTVLEARDVAFLQPHPRPSDHKYSQGVVGIAAGSARYPGAAVLTVGAALLTKPGLVRYSGTVAHDVVSAWPSAIVSTAPPTDVGRVQAWGVGPGLGVDAAGKQVLSAVLEQQLPTVVDADALTLVADDAQLLVGRTAPTVLTPHEGEFSRLAPDLDLARDRSGAVRTLASRSGCTVLLKGPVTVVADPDGRLRLNPTGTPWLATAGTGDVLTGMIASYLAAGLAPFDASSVAAFVHGIAGRIAASDAPCTSRDVVDALPEAIRVIGAE